MSIVKPMPDPAAVRAAAARHGSFVGQDNASQRQEAWQREMERAQMSAWFKPSPTGTQGNASTPSDRDGPVPARARMRQAAGASQGAANVPAAPRLPSSPDARQKVALASARAGDASFASDTVQLQRTIGQSSSHLRHGISDPPQDVSSSTGVHPRMRAGFLVPPSMNESGMESASASEPQGARDPASCSSKAEEQAPLRLHEESLPEGQAVWIAMRADDDALTAMLPRIVADVLRAISLERGQRLYQVVCNGKLVWRDVAGAAASVDSSTGNSSSSGVDRRSTVFDTFQSKGA